MGLLLMFAVRLASVRAGRASGIERDETGIDVPTHARVTGQADREPSLFTVFQSS